MLLVRRIISSIRRTGKFGRQSHIKTRPFPNDDWRAVGYDWTLHSYGSEQTLQLMTLTTMAMTVMMHVPLAAGWRLLLADVFVASAAASPLWCTDSPASLNTAADEIQCNTALDDHVPIPKAAGPKRSRTLWDSACVPKWLDTDWPNVAWWPKYREVETFYKVHPAGAADRRGTGNKWVKSPLMHTRIIWCKAS